MSIDFACASCGTKYSVNDDMAGKAAKCKCGARIQIPVPSQIESSPLDDLFDELPRTAAPSPPASSATSTAKSSKSGPSAEEATEAIKKLSYTLVGNRGMYGLGRIFEGNGLAIGKIAAGAVVGGILGFQALARNRNEAAIDESLRLPLVAGTAAVGAAVASLLLLADAVRKRRNEGRYVPLVARLYFASRWLSLLIWIVTVFVLVVASVGLLAWMESPPR